MDLKEAMKARHMVRKFTDKALDGDEIEKLNERIKQLNETNGVKMKLVINDDKVLFAVVKLFLAKGVKNYIVLSGADSPELEEKLGIASADIMLYAQTLGLNTWWIGGTFNRGAIQCDDGNRVIGIVAVGYGQTQGAPHKSKRYEDVAWYDGEAPEWFKDGVEAALLAPTALNRQSFVINGEGNRVKIEYAKGAFSGADLGLVKYHFELGAGKENFVWK